MWHEQWGLRQILCICFCLFFVLSSFCQVLWRWRTRQIGIGPLLYGFTGYSSFFFKILFTLWLYLYLAHLFGHFSFARLNTYAFEMKWIISSLPFPTCIHKTFLFRFKSFFLSSSFFHCFVIHSIQGYLYLFTWYIQHVWFTVEVLLSFVIYTRSHTHRICLPLPFF